jgi:YD repeat-containing protein
MFGSKREAVLRFVFILLGVMALAFSDYAYADTYTYDSLGRLTGVTYTDGSSIIYAYDSAGNRTTVTQTAAP